MRVTLAAIGRLKEGGEQDLVDRYTTRFDQSGRAVSLGPMAIAELPESRLASAPLRKADEAQRLLRAVAAAQAVIALDEHGAQLSSVEFAKRLAALRDAGMSHLAFVIGGPDGHGETVLAAARQTLSLGAMTLPHGLARVLLAEQLYRAVTILSGHPYHRA
jgi:23S rRNA (pseudouridine1915-N3)-methyltransferase